ncbi:hypothetical protein ACMAZA_01950 [Pseudothioglobus sp. nBUS_23]|uniref:hypothetical protein n=1 Tax=Pseudothioglobus sp. nBUS_23 TaxID=3395318 RepID=UPI003EC055B3
MSTEPLNKKILLLTYAFPPLQSSESFLSIKALAKIENIDIDILTIDARKIGYDLDSSLDTYTNKYFGEIYRVSPSRFISTKLFKFLRYVPSFPDRFRFFNSRLLKKANEIGIENYDSILSWSTWHSIHLVAASIKKRHPSIRWVAHLSDPWADNPFLTRFFGYKASQYFLEKKALSSADAINFTTNSIRLLVMKKYPKSWINKTFVTPHSFDNSLYPRNVSPKKNNGSFVINYLGNFYGPRNPKNLVKALIQIHNEDKDLLSNVVFRFVGKWIGNENWLSTITELPDGLIQTSPPISYKDSLNEMAQSDLLLILDAPFESSVFFPSKLVDYIGARKPIFAITPKGSCYDILKEVGGILASPQSVDSIKDGIIEAITKLKKGELIFPSKKKSERYSNSYVSEEYELLFRIILNN